jgi:hypothetical protein
MKKTFLLISTGVWLMAACTPKQDQQNQESTASKADSLVIAMASDEQAEGFVQLFDGSNTDKWYTYHKDSTTWSLENGVLHTKGGNHDLVSKDEYESFDLRFDWNVGKGGNSGVMYMVQDRPEIDETYKSGIEYQIIDDKNWPDKLEEAQKPGAVYDLYAPLKMIAKPSGEWNSGRIVNDKGHITHYVNGEKTAEYDWNSDDYKARFNKSKFKDWPFGKVMKGRLALQDHGQEVSYKNIRIKTL